MTAPEPLEHSVFEVMKLYLNGSRVFIQLSSAGLLVPIVLPTDVVGIFGRDHALSLAERVVVFVSWAAFLMAIGAGALYQYAAVKFLEYKADQEGTHLPRPLKWLVLEAGPGVAYGIMVVAFYIGATAVVAYSSIALLS
jgi:hypothetical protein